MTNFVILSPHFDDAVGSLGGCIQRWVSQSAKVSIMTMTGGIPEAAPARDLVQRRRLEDVEACSRLGCDYLHLPIYDAPYREPSNGEGLYTTPFRPPSDKDRALAMLKGAMRQLDRRASVFVPMGLGGHVDHLICRLAGEQLSHDGYKVYLYRDFFYHVRESTNNSGSAVFLSEQEVAQKIYAFSAYQSQIPGLYGGYSGLVAAFRRDEASELIVPLTS